MVAFGILLALLGAPEPDPPLTDLTWFPSHETSRKYQIFASQHRDWLAFQVEWHQWAQEEITESKMEAAWCWKAWDHLVDASYPYLHDNERRQHLGKLRDQIGRAAYEAGRMPPPVPVWRFRQADR